MNLVPSLRAAVSSLCALALAATSALGAGIVRNAPTLKESAPLPSIDLDDPSSQRTFTLADQ